MSEILADYLTRADLAKQLGIHERTLIRWHDLGEGPPVTKIGRTTLYHRPAIAAWLASRQKAAA